MDKLERRKSVLEEDNTAQDEFVNLVEKMKKNAKTLSVSTPLNGNLNLSILADKGISKLQTISFSPGNITKLQNIPASIKTIQCPDNLLMDLEDLPDSLERLEVPHNIIKELDFSRIKRLTHLNVEFNRLKELAGFPEGLIELFCSHNEIKSLDFKHTPTLKKLHCNYNPRLVLYNLPDGLEETEFPDTMMHDQTDSSDKTKEHDKTKEQTYHDALRKYFEIKYDYERKIIRKKRDRGRKKSKPIVNPPCIGCGKTGGMIFSSKNEKYTAICGNVPSCNWKIEIYHGFYSTNNDVLYAFMEDVETYKENIIRQKMDTLFGYVDEKRTSKLFEDQLLAYKESSEQIKELLSKREDMYFNPAKQEQIQTKRTEIQSWIQEVKHALAENDIVRATEIQAKEILPRAEYIQRQMYEKMYTHFNDSTFENILVQEPVLFSKTEELLSEPPSVIQFGKPTKN